MVSLPCSENAQQQNRLLTIFFYHITIKGNVLLTIAIFDLILEDNALAHRFDSVVDIIHAITKRMLLYNLDGNVNEDLIRFAELIEKAVDFLAQAIKGVRNLKNARLITEACIEINRLENLGDLLRDETIGKLFDNSFEPLYIIKWKDIFQDAERTLDQCEDVANVIESIMVKQG